MDAPSNGSSKALSEACDAIQRSLDISAGPVARAALIHMGPGDARLLMVVHHLVMDGVAWRIVLEDLVSAYDALRGDLDVSLPPKTTSFGAYAERLVELADSEAVLRSADYWANLRPASRRVPADGGEVEARPGPEDEVELELSEVATTALLRRAAPGYGARADELLLAGLTRTLAGWLGGARFLFATERHGREYLGEDIDLVRTVGWLASSFPVQVELPVDDDLASMVFSVVDQLRRIPDNGLSYGLLRYLASDDAVRHRIAQSPVPEVWFGFDGQVDEAGSRLLRLAAESHGAIQSARHARPYLLSFDTRVSHGRLRIVVRYRALWHRRQTIERLVLAYRSVLEEIAEGRDARPGLDLAARHEGLVKRP
jgi:non-ribosomal peptide synthase protein (TIGR01720 family)